MDSKYCLNLRKREQDAERQEAEIQETRPQRLQEWKQRQQLLREEEEINKLLEERANEFSQ